MVMDGCFLSFVVDTPSYVMGTKKWLKLATPRSLHDGEMEIDLLRFMCLSTFEWMLSRL